MNLVNRTARRLQRAADRLARLEAGAPSARLASAGDGALLDQARAWLVTGAKVAAAKRRLHAVQRRVEAEGALPRLTALQERLDRSREERRRQLSEADTQARAIPSWPRNSSSTRCSRRPSS